MLRDMEAVTISLIRYRAPQLELELDPWPTTRGGSVERPGLWDGGGINDDGGGGGDSDGNANVMARHHKQVAYGD